MNTFRKLLEDNMDEICETNRRMQVIGAVVRKYQPMLTLAAMLAICVVPSFAQLTPTTNPFPGQGDQTITSWGDSATNLFLYLLPLGSIFCVGMIVFNIIRKQPWGNYGIGLFMCLGGWGFVGWIAYQAANGKTIKPTGGLGH